MSNRRQMEENIQTFAEDKPLNAKELETIHSIADSMVKKISVALYSLPLLHKPLPPGFGYSRPAGSVQRTLLYAGRVYCPDGPVCDSCGEAAQRLYWLPQL